AVLGVQERNVQRWVGWYRAGGLPAVMAHRSQGPGKPAFLHPEQQSQLVAQSATRPFRTAAEARQWVQATFGVAYTDGGMDALVGRLRIHPKVRPPEGAASRQSEGGPG
ncbi:MAG: hypothetical protein M3442_03260, partial [Chloroflexota bacterium]|nr:hypothetical protein [Chloroflexota bacterium]